MNRFRVVVMSVVVVCACAWSQSAWAKPEPIPAPGHQGFGLGIGALSYGLSYKRYLTPQSAIQANLGAYLTNERRRVGNLFAVGADYLFEFGPITEANDIGLHWYAGPGIAAGASAKSYWALDVNACIGLSFLFHELPLDFAFEYRPGVRIKTPGLFDSPERFAPNFGSFGVHMRYYSF